MDLVNENPWEGILSSTMFAMRSIVHTFMQHTMSQLVFGRDAIPNINQEASWQLIKHRKQVFINKDNQKENRRRQSHLYRARAYIDPYTVIEVWNNGTVFARKGNVTDTYSNITPFKE